MNKTLFTLSYVFFLGTLALSPSFAHASSRAACDDIKSKEKRADTLFDLHRNNLERLENDFETTLENELTQFEQKRNAQKKTAEETLKRHIDMVSKLGATGVQQSKIDVYLKSVQTISQERTRSIESAQQEYKEGIKQIFDQKKSIEKILLEEYKDSSKKAFEITFSDCEKGRSSFLFKRELKRAVDDGHKRFTTKLSTLEFKESLDALKIARDQKIQAAQKLFSEKHTSLINTLRTSLSQ